MSKPNPLPTASRPQPTEAELQAQAEQQLNQLLAEVRMLETYYNEAVARVQTASTALNDTRSAIDAINGISTDPQNEFLVPIGGGLLLPVKDLGATRIVLSVGAGVAIEKDLVSAKSYLQIREKELEKALSSLDQQRREIGSRLEQDRSILQQVTGQR
ncbi:MAG: prefoldin subunit alpha [Thaumarchaeota archaeon]|nr:prefoldin subunit alpha [Nitrososphaerota archaeon]